MRRYWIRIAGKGRWGFSSFGVTAVDATDALAFLHEFCGDLSVDVVETVEDVLIADLDQKHVVPNMGNHFRRGIWWPAISTWSP